MTFLAWQVLKNDLTSIYGQHYGPTRDENDGEAIFSGGSFTKPIHVFIKRNVDSVFKIGIRPVSGTDTLNKVSITGALGGTSGPTVGIIEDDFYVDERHAITNGVIAQFITPVVQVSDDKNFICWLAFRNLTDDIRKDYNLQIVINDTETFDLVITNYQILKEYKTIERVYSDKPLIDKITEDVRLHTVSNIDALQLGLIPYWIQDLRYEKTWVYYKDEKDEVLHDPFYNTIGIKVGNIPNNTLLNTEAPRFFDINIFKEYKIDTLRTYVRPFLLFINRVFISWDRIRMVKSDDQIFFAVTGIDSEEVVTSVDILMLPDEALYVQKDGLEGWNPRADYNYLFCFTMDGRMGGMDIFVYVRDPTVKGIVYHQPQYRDEILDVKFDQKLTANNFFVFDDDGYLCKNYDLEIKNGNVFTLNAGAIEDYRVAIILSVQSNYSNSHITQGRFNPAFAQSVIANKKMWAEFDMTKDRLMKDFDYQYDKNLSYDTNLQNGYDYTWDHNVKHYDFVPWFYRPINRQPLDPARIISQIRAAGKVSKDISFSYDSVPYKTLLTKDVSFDFTPRLWVAKDVSFDIDIESNDDFVNVMSRITLRYDIKFTSTLNNSYKSLLNGNSFAESTGTSNKWQTWFSGVYNPSDPSGTSIYFATDTIFNTSWSFDIIGRYGSDLKAILQNKINDGFTNMTITLLSCDTYPFPSFSITKDIAAVISQNSGSADHYLTFPAHWYSEPLAYKKTFSYNDFKTGFIDPVANFGNENLYPDKVSITFT